MFDRSKSPTRKQPHVSPQLIRIREEENIVAENQRIQFILRNQRINNSVMTKQLHDKFNANVSKLIPGSKNYNTVVTRKKKTNLLGSGLDSLNHSLMGDNVYENSIFVTSPNQYIYEGIDSGLRHARNSVGSEMPSPNGRNDSMKTISLKKNSSMRPNAKAYTGLNVKNRPLKFDFKQVNKID